MCARTGSQEPPRAEITVVRTLANLPLSQPFTIIAICVLAAVAYGLVHDQITIRICPQYLTVTHPKITHSTSLTIIALAWGVAATWWVGASLGLLLAVAARAGSEPRLRARWLLRPILVLLLANAVLASGAGLAGYVLARLDVIKPPGELADELAPEVHDLWMSVWWTHSSSYLVGGLGGLVLIAWTLRTRWSMRHR